MFCELSWCGGYQLHYHTKDVNINDIILKRYDIHFPTLSDGLTKFYPCRTLLSIRETVIWWL